MTVTNEYLRTLTDEALDAFWQVIVGHYPLAESGDLSPLTTFTLQLAAEDAVAEWIDSNASPLRA